MKVLYIVNKPSFPDLRKNGPAYSYIKVLQNLVTVTSKVKGYSNTRTLTSFKNSVLRP